MNHASTPGTRGQDGPHDAEPFFPSEGTFNPVVPLSEIGHESAVAPLPPVNPADVGKPAEAVWARDAHRARWKEEEETLVPTRRARARGGRRSWVATATVITLSVLAGLASGTYLLWSSQRPAEALPPARAAAEAPSLPPPPVAEQAEAVTKVEKVKEPAGDEQPSEVAKVSEVAKAERPSEVTPAPKQSPAPRTETPPRAERVARTVEEPREAAPAPRPSRSQAAASPRPRPAAAERQPPAPVTSARPLPVSTPPPSAGSKKVIQWP